MNYFKGYVWFVVLILVTENELFALQSDLGQQTKIETDLNAARAAMGFLILSMLFTHKKDPFTKINNA